MNYSGPIDYLVLEFPEGKWTGAPLRALLDVVDRGLIQILDLRAVRRELDGTFQAIALADIDGDGTLDLSVFEGVGSGLLDDEDLGEAARILQPGTSAALLVYENTWAAPFVEAAMGAGAQLVASGRIPAPDVAAALERLEAAS